MNSRTSVLTRFRDDRGDARLDQLFIVVLWGVLIVSLIVAASALIARWGGSVAGEYLAVIAEAQEESFESSGSYFEIDADGQPVGDVDVEEYETRVPDGRFASLVCEDGYLLRVTTNADVTIYLSSRGGVISESLSDLNLDSCVSDLLDVQPEFELEVKG